MRLREEVKVECSGLVRVWACGFKATEPILCYDVGFAAFRHFDISAEEVR